MAHQANLAPAREESQPGLRPRPKAAPGVKIVAGVALGLLALVALAVWVSIRLFG